MHEYVMHAMADGVVACYICMSNDNEEKVA